MQTNILSVSLIQHFHALIVLFINYWLRLTVGGISFLSVFKLFSLI